MILASDGGPMCFAGGLQQIGGFADQLPGILDAFHNGSGVAQAAYSPDLLEGMERLSATWFQHELVDHWIAPMLVATGCGAVVWSPTSGAAVDGR